MAESDQVVLTVSTGLASGGQNQRDYNYVGTFPGVPNPAGFKRFPGGAPRKQSVSYATGVTSPFARSQVKFKV
jgi:hypothetical protein